MKNIITLMILLSSLIIQAQEAALKLDFVQTKTGEKYYGKITEMDPKTGITIKTYGDGNLVKLKHDEIETIKIASNEVAVEEKEIKEKKEKRVWFKMGVLPTAVLNLRDLSTDIDPVNNLNFNRVGLHIQPTLLFKNHNSLSLFVGFEQGKNMDVVPVGLQFVFGKSISEKSVLGFALSAGVLSTSIYAGDIPYSYIWKPSTIYVDNKTRSTSLRLGQFIGLGITYTKDMDTKLLGVRKLFIATIIQLENRVLTIYNSPSYINNTQFYAKSIVDLETFSLKIQAGFLF